MQGSCKVVPLSYLGEQSEVAEFTSKNGIYRISNLLEIYNTGLTHWKINVYIYINTYIYIYIIIHTNKLTSKCRVSKIGHAHVMGIKHGWMGNLPFEIRVSLKKNGEVIDGNSHI